MESVVGTEIINHKTESKQSAPSRAQRLAKAGDVFYQTVRPYQRNNCLFEGAETSYVFSTGYAQLRSYGDSYFLLTMLQNDGFVNEVLERCTGTSYPAINSNILAEINVNCPTNIQEQKYIGMYFSNLDNLITLHQRKLEKLQNLKKAMLEKMFPKNGAKVPEIRFKGFTDDWEQRKLLDLLDQPITDGPHETPNIVDDGVPFISADAIVNNKVDFSRKRGNITEEYNLECCKKYKPELYDVYLVKSGSTVGKVAIVETTEKFNIWSPLAAMRCQKKSNPYFLFFLLQTRKIQTQVKDKSSNGTQPNLSMRILEKFDVIVPKNKEEQLAIGCFFQKLDNTLTLHQRKLEKLQNLKKAMLEKMFI